MGRNTALGSALIIQKRVVHALLMREALTRYGRHNLGFLWLFIEPMLFTIGITIFWTVTKSIHGSNLPIVPFAITGYSSVLLWRNMPARLVGAIEPNAGLMHHRNVRLIDIYISRLILEAGGVTISFVFLTALFVAVEWTHWPEDVLTVMLGWLLLNWFGWSLAFFIGSLSERTEIIDKLWHPVTYFLFPLSGAAFIVDPLPEVAQKIALALPMVHCTEIIREGFFGSAFTPHYSIAYVVAFCSVLSVAGLMNTAYVSRRIVLE
jgi:capsular polysaccharide transport system permease protein